MYLLFLKNCNKNFYIKSTSALKSKLAIAKKDCTDRKMKKYELFINIFIKLSCYESEKGNALIEKSDCSGFQAAKLIFSFE